MTIDIAKASVGLLVAAGLVHFAPAYATAGGLLALAVGAFLVGVFKAKGLAAAVVLVIGAIAFGALTGTSPPGFDQLGDRIPDASALTDLAGGVGR